MRPGSGIIALVLAALFLPEATLSLPRFASRTAAKCQSCHVNPSGGGMRTPFGVTYGRDELPVPTWSEDLAIDDFSTQVTDVISVGADVRTLFFYQKTPSSSNNAFWQMQGDIYLNLRLAKKVSVYLDKGIYSGFEIFGLLNILPPNGHIKVGRFLPNYGLKNDDHTAFARQVTGFSPEGGRAELTGLEAAVAPGPLTIMGGVFNASDGFGAGTGSKKALLGRVDGMFKLDGEGSVGFGANVFRRESATGAKTTLLGGTGAFSYGQVTLFGEVTLVKTKSASASTTGVVSYAEVSWMVVQGLDLKFAYDFHDPDKDLKTGSRSRYSFGFEVFPISGVEVRPMYRLNKEEPTAVDNDEFHLLIHFYF